MKGLYLINQTWGKLNKHFGAKYELLITGSGFGANIYILGAAANTMQLPGLVHNAEEDDNNGSVRTITDSIVTMQMVSNATIQTQIKQFAAMHRDLQLAMTVLSA